jgi:DNA-binding winged helix-turn-helix (wHTH) protein
MPQVNTLDTIAPTTLAALTPQAFALLSHMLKHGSVTQREALMDLSVQSLTKRISELRKYFRIVTDRRVHKTTEQRYVRYFLKEALCA